MLSTQSQRTLETLTSIRSLGEGRMPNIRQIHRLFSELSLEHSYIESLGLIEYTINNRRFSLWTREGLRGRERNILCFIEGREYNN